MPDGPVAFSPGVRSASSAQEGGLPAHARSRRPPRTPDSACCCGGGSHVLPLRDREFALVFTVLSFAAPLARIGAQLRRPPRPRRVRRERAADLGAGLPLAVRTRWPAACLAVVGISFAVHESLGCPPTFGSLGLYIALYSVGAHQNALRRIVPLAATGGYVVFGVVLHALGSPNGLTDYLVFHVALTAMWGLGVLVRGRRVARGRAPAAVRAGGHRRGTQPHGPGVARRGDPPCDGDGGAGRRGPVPHRLAGPAQRGALETINGTGRRALAELRFLLGVLEATGDAEPRPGRPRLAGCPTWWSRRARAASPSS